MAVLNPASASIVSGSRSWKEMFDSIELNYKCIIYIVLGTIIQPLPKQL